MPIIPALGRQRQRQKNGLKLEASLVYRVRSSIAWATE